MGTILLILTPIICLVGSIACMLALGSRQKLYQVHCSQHGLTFTYESIDGCKDFINKMYNNPEEHGISDNCKLTIKSTYVFH